MIQRRLAAEKQELGKLDALESEIAKELGATSRRLARSRRSPSAFDVKQRHHGSVDLLSMFL